MDGESILERAAEKFALPADVLAGMPRIEIIGGRQVYIENHKGVMEYGENVIDVNGGKVVVHIVGSGLNLRAMNQREMLIGGNIESVSFQY